MQSFFDNFTIASLIILFEILFSGDQKDESAVLEWLLDADNRELDDAIEMVNEKMLVKLLEKTQFMAVFFCKYRWSLSLNDLHLSYLSIRIKNQSYSF